MSEQSIKEFNTEYPAVWFCQDYVLNQRVALSIYIVFRILYCIELKYPDENAASYITMKTPTKFFLEGFKPEDFKHFRSRPYLLRKWKAELKLYYETYLNGLKAEKKKQAIENLLPVADEFKLIIGRDINYFGRSGRSPRDSKESHF